METEKSYLNDMIEDSVVWKGNHGEAKVFTKNDIPAILYLDNPKTRYQQEYRAIVSMDAELSNAETYKVEVKFKTAFDRNEEISNKVEHIYFIGYGYDDIKENITLVLGNVETFKIIRKYVSSYDANKDIIRLKPAKKKRSFMLTLILSLVAAMILFLIGGLVYTTVATTSKVEQQYQQIQELQEKVDNQDEVIKQYKSHEVEELLKKSKQLEQQVANKKK